MASVLHRSARTTPRVRAELQASQESTRARAARYGLNPKIKHFYGRSENAVRIQIAIARIAFLTMHLLRTMTKVEHGLKKLVLLARANLMHRKDVTRLDQSQRPPPIDSRQLTLDLSST